MDQGEEMFREKNKEMEWIQRPNSESFGTEVQLFTHKIGRLQDLYMSPQGFEFDVTNNDPPFISDKSSPDFNAG